MPFDALVAVTRQRAISNSLEDHGLKAVPWETLAEHKVAQQRRYGPSFWYRNQTILSILLVVASPMAGAVAGASGGFSAHSGVLAITGSFVWMCMVALITGTGLIKLRAGSHWEERQVSVSFLADADIPEPIARVTGCRRRCAGSAADPRRAEAGRDGTRSLHPHRAGWRVRLPGHLGHRTRGRLRTMT